MKVFEAEDERGKRSGESAFPLRYLSRPKRVESPLQKMMGLITTPGQIQTIIGACDIGLSSSFKILAAIKSFTMSQQALARYARFIFDRYRHESPKCK